VANFELVFKKYRERLLQIKECVVRTVELDHEGGLTKEQTIPFLDKCEKQIEEIEDCVRLLQRIQRQRPG